MKNWFPSHQQGTVEELIREMIRRPDAPLEGYGGARDNVRLRDMEEAKTFIRERGVELPWHLRDRSVAGGHEHPAYRMFG